MKFAQSQAGQRRAEAGKTRRVKSGRKFLTAPRVRTARKATRSAIETQDDLSKLLGAAAIVQQQFFLATRKQLEAEARRAFEAGSAALFQPEPVAQTDKVAGDIAELLAAARVLGIARVLEEGKIQRRKKEPEFAEVLKGIPPQEAIKFLQSLPAVARDEFNRMVAAGRFRAFTVGTRLTEVQVRTIRSILVRSLELGEPPASFIRRVRTAFDQLQVSARALRTTWTNSLGQSMHDGREQALEDPEVAALLTHGAFDAMNDGFTRPNHRALDNAIATSAWWRGPGRRMMPLLGHNCRCAVIWIARADAQRRLSSAPWWNIEEQGIPLGAGPDAGFK